MLEPRRLAARAAAERLASELGEKVGETVGYRIRLDSKVGPNTRIEVVTEGILTRRLQDDPALDGVGLLIFDEFHERSLDADLALALSLNGRELFRDEQPLKILLMSATLEGERLPGCSTTRRSCAVKGACTRCRCAGGGRSSLGEFIEPRLVQTILEALHDETGSVLVFLPGQAEIRRVNQQLADALGERGDVLLCPLHGELDLAAQRAAIDPAPGGQAQGGAGHQHRRDQPDHRWRARGDRRRAGAGAAFRPRQRHDPPRHPAHLPRQRHPACRPGRAAGAGRVLSLVVRGPAREGLAAYGSAEILSADLAGLALQLARWGVTPAAIGVARYAAHCRLCPGPGLARTPGGASRTQT
jgi:ATP-dependent helicase HrpB